MQHQPLAAIANPKARVDEFDHRLRQQSAPELWRTLLEAITDIYPPLRQRAGEAAAEVADESFEEVLRALAHGDAAAAVEATEALGLPADAAPSPLAPVRQAACMALRSSHAPQTRTVLLRATFDDDADVRYRALVSLHAIDATGRQFHDAVARRLGDDDSEVAVVAAQIAAQRGWTDLAGNIVQRYEQFLRSDKLQMALCLTEMVGEHGLELNAKLVDQMVDELIDALHEETTIAAASKALVQLGAERARAPLQTVLDRWFAHPILKVEAAGALHQLGDQKGTDYLEKSLDSSRKDARGYAIRVVGRLHIADFFDEIVVLARSNDYHADTAVLALGDYGGDDARAVLEDIAANHPDDEVRALADNALKNANNFPTAKPPRR